MNQDNMSLKQVIDSMIDMFQQEINSLQIVGRELTQKELRRIESLEQIVISLNNAFSLLLAGDDDEVIEDGIPVDEPNVILKDGRYTAAGSHIHGDLRLDTEENGIMSMDFYLGTVGTGRYLASLRSNPGATIRPGQKRIKVIGQDDDGNRTAGIVEINPISTVQATIIVNLENGLNGMPVNVSLVLSASWQSSYFRTIGLEVDSEEGNEELPSYLLEEQNITVESGFSEAGIEMIAAGRRDSIPKKPNGWSDAELHGLMNTFANENLDERAWLLHLLVLSNSTTRGLLGVMFDSGRLDINGLPRQGVAVFTDAIKTHRAGFERKAIQTIMHELGHALNLAHRFERTVSRADSLSCMNYDWRYLGGDRQEQFWRDFRFNFDEDEIRFLRHSPRTALIPGGAEFHTVNYWSDGTGGYSPYYREVELRGVELKLQTPPSGPLFEFAQPIILTISLKNTSGRALNIPIQFLDPKAGALEILIRRIGIPDSSDINNKQFSFSPLVNRCWDATDMSAGDRVENGGSLTNNVNLTFGSSGFTFAEPGDYEITALISLVDNVRRIDRIVQSNPVRIRVAHPQTLEEERDAMDIFQKDIGFFLALGGSDVLSKEEDKLMEICERREHEKTDDPLVAHIKRVDAINKSRDFTTYDSKSGKFKLRRAKPKEAFDLLDELEKNESQFFDVATQEGLADLKANLKKRIDK